MHNAGIKLIIALSFLSGYAVSNFKQQVETNRAPSSIPEGSSDTAALGVQELQEKICEQENHIKKLEKEIEEKLAETKAVLEEAEKEEQERENELEEKLAIVEHAAFTRAAQGTYFAGNPAQQVQAPSISPYYLMAQEMVKHFMQKPLFEQDYAYQVQAQQEFLNSMSVDPLAGQNIIINNYYYQAGLPPWAGPQTQQAPLGSSNPPLNRYDPNHIYHAGDQRYINLSPERFQLQEPNLNFSSLRSSPTLLPQ